MASYSNLIKQIKTNLYPWDDEIKIPISTAISPPQAAVLIPIIQHESQYTVLFTQRTEHLSNHPGQISFPGGRKEVGDPHLLATALRETFEEIGVEAKAIEILGKCSQTRTISGFGFEVTPFVGLIKAPLALTLDKAEVAGVFEVPLSFLLSSGNYQRKTRYYRGKNRRYFLVQYQQYTIWGATAAMCHELMTLCKFK